MEAVLLSQVMALRSIAVTFGFLPSLALKAVRAQKKLYIHSIVMFLVKVILIIGLVYFYGIWGAVFARIIGEIISSLLSVVFFYLHQRKR